MAERTEEGAAPAGGALQQPRGQARAGGLEERAWAVRSPLEGPHPAVPTPPQGLTEPRPHHSFTLRLWGHFRGHLGFYGAIHGEACLGGRRQPAQLPQGTSGPPGACPGDSLLISRCSWQLDLDLPEPEDSGNAALSTPWGSPQGPERWGSVPSGRVRSQCGSVVSSNSGS